MEGDSAAPDQVNLAMNTDNEQAKPSTTSSATEDEPQISNGAAKEQSQPQGGSSADSKPSISTAPTSPDAEDPNKAVLPGNLRDYDEYKHDSPEEIRKNQLKELAPEHTANIPGIHHTRQYSKVQPESYMWLSLFTMILFSRIFGALALYKSIRVRLLFKDGEHEKAEEASNAAKKLNIVGMIFCLSWVILVIILIKGFGVF